MVERGDNMLVKLLPIACAASFALGQGAVRCWGGAVFDTASRDARCVSIDAREEVAVLRLSNGSDCFQGQNLVGVLEVPPPPPGLNYVQYEFEGLHAAALLSDGTIRAWGNGWQPPGPIPNPGPGHRFVDLALGSSHGLALRDDGVVATWGWNWSGQLNIPAPPLGVSYTDVLAFANVSALLRDDGQIVAVGDPMSGLPMVPGLPTGVTYTGVWFGGGTLLATRSDGQLVAWGNNAGGQLSIPGLPPGLRYVQAAGGSSHAIALRSDGTVICWGSNGVGQCDTPHRLRGGGVVQVAATNGCSLARLTSGEIVAWGQSLSMAGTIASLPKVPGTWEPAARHVGISAGDYFYAFVLSDGTIQAFGHNSVGQCDVPSSPSGVGYLRVDCGTGHTVALRSDGQLVAWGLPQRTNVPPLPAGVSYVDMAACSSHTVALRSDGEAVFFGFAAFGSDAIPPLPPGLRYIDTDVVYGRTGLVRSDGVLVLVGQYTTGVHAVPGLPPGVGYRRMGITDGQVGAIRTDGEMEVWGAPGLTIPPLPAGVSYVEVEGGSTALAFRRSDGSIVIGGTGGWRQEIVPPLEPGTSYVEVAAGDYTVIGRIGPPSTFTSFAFGCAGSRLASRLIPLDTPRIGVPLQVDVRDVPAHVVIAGLGFARQSAFALDPLGMPGCVWHVVPQVILPLVAPSSVARCEVMIPDDPSLVGVSFHIQALLLDPAASNAAGAVVSDAATGVVGHW